MPLPRPSRRLILIATLLLLAGAIVNVTVAWVLVGAPESWTPGGQSSTYLPVIDADDALIHDITQSQLARHEREVERARRSLRAPPEWPELSLANITRGPLGWSYTKGIYGVRGERLVLTRVQSGWPAHAMTYHGVFREGDQKTRYVRSLAPPQFLSPTTDWFPTPRERLPLTPIPTGFALNTLFYAVVVGAILALPLTFFPLRRRHRARRGRCPTCGYDRAGITDPATPCPECGDAGEQRAFLRGRGPAEYHHRGSESTEG